MTANGASLHFLVVDDDRHIRDVLVRMVERLGHTADQATDGVDAVDALVTNDYDVMLLDLTMPRMTGQDVLRWRAEHPQRSRGMRVIVVSAFTEAHANILETLGADAVVPKPLRAQQLLDLIAASRPSTVG